MQLCIGTLECECSVCHPTVFEATIGISWLQGLCEVSYNVECLLSYFVHDVQLTPPFHCDPSYLFFRRFCFSNGRPSFLLLCSFTMSSHFNSHPTSFQEPLLAAGDPCIPPSSTNNSLSRCRAPPPSPILRPQGLCAYGESCSSPSCAMPTVDEQLAKHAKKLSKSPGPAHETYMRKTLSVDSSPLHQVSLADDVSIHNGLPSTKKEKSTKLSDPPIFTDGIDPIWEDWSTKIEEKLAASKGHYRTEPSQIAYVVFRLGGPAARHTVERRRRGAPDPYLSVKDILEHLAGIYESTDGRLNADREIDAATLTSSGSPSPTSSDADTLLEERPNNRRIIPPALYFKGEGDDDSSTWPPFTSDTSPPISPTLSESSLNSTTPLFSNRFRTRSEHNDPSEPRPSVKVSQISPPLSTTSITEVTTIPRIHVRRISLPIESNSSIDARIRPSSISSNNVAIKPFLPTSPPNPLPAKATTAKSWPKRHHRAKTRGMERKEAASVDPTSRFSDDEDDDACKSLGRIFGNCFRGRKA